MYSVIFNQSETLLENMIKKQLSWVIYCDVTRTVMEDMVTIFGNPCIFPHFIQVSSNTYLLLFSWKYEKMTMLGEV